MKSLRYRASLLLWVLFFAACQPYPDHGEVIAHFHEDRVDFGKRRELSLVQTSGDGDHLLLEFNQPIAELGERDVPFELSFQPHIPGAKASLTGCASVRVEFPRPLSRAHRYRAIIPKGWRALTGASFVRGKTVEWETGRPKLLGVSPDEGEQDLETTYTLRLNQEVSPESLSRSLQLTELGTGVHSPGEVVDVQSLGEGLYRIELGGLSSEVHYQLEVLAGLKALSGPLEGSGGESFPLGAGPLAYLGATEQPANLGSVSLEFSHAVDKREILRHLKGVEPSRVSLETRDNLTFQLSWPGLARARQKQAITLLAGLSSETGYLLGKSVRISVIPSVEKAVPSALREPEQVGPKATVHARRIKKGSRVATWSVTRSQFLGLLRLPEKVWSAKQKMPEELAAPVFKKSLEKDFPATRFLSKDESDPHNFLLVRIVDPKGAVHRLLLSRTSQNVLTWHINDGVVAKVAEGAKVELLDKSGQVLAQTVADSQGFVSFQGPWASRPMFLSAAVKNNVALQSLSQVKVPIPEHVPGFLWSEDSIYRPSEVCSYIGIWFAQGPREELVLRDQHGEQQKLESHFVESLGPFFVGRFALPGRPGAYTLDFLSTSETGAGLPFLVTRLRAESLSQARIELDETEEPQNVTGHYTWLGPGESELVLRARFKPQLQSRDGWRSSVPGQTNWFHLPVELDYHFLQTRFTVGKLPEVEGAWQLELELVDKNCPDLVVARAYKDLGTPLLTLLGAQVKELSLQDRLTKFRFEFNDGSQDRLLRCRLYRDSDHDLAPWSLEDEGEAEWRNGVFEWGVGIFQPGRYRVECTWEAEDGIQRSSSFERTVTTQQVRGLAPLATHSADESPFGALDISWPELAEERNVWVSVLNSSGLVSSELFATQEQQVGAVERPLPHLGEKEHLLIAGWRKSGEQNYELRALRVPVNSAFTLKEPILTSAEREDMAELEPKIKSRLQIPLSAWAKAELKTYLVWWRPAQQLSSERPMALPSQLSPLHLEVPNRRGLPFAGPLEIQDEQNLEIATPELPGQFELCLLGLDSEGSFSFQVQALEVVQGARWEPLIPPVFRPRDEFFAGLRFWSDPKELTPTGVTSSVSLTSTLLPRTYFSTANLIDPASRGDMLFSYQAPSFLAASQAHNYQLEWELGVEGEAIPVSVGLTCLPTRTKDSLRRVASVEQDRSFRFNLASLDFWKLRLSMDQGPSPDLESVIRISGLGDKVEEVQLDHNNQTFEFFGQDETFLDVRLAQGPQVKLELYQLEPTQQERSLKGLGLYLLRRMEGKDGGALDRSELLGDSDYSAAHHLVLPEKKSGLFLESPIPGGLTATGCWLSEGKTLTLLPWTAQEGAVRVELPELEPGEHVVKVGLRTVVPGQFDWPGARVVDAQGKMEAQVPSVGIGVEES